MLRVKQESCGNGSNFKEIGLTRLGIELKSTVAEAVVLTTRPSDLFIIARERFLQLLFFSFPLQKDSNFCVEVLNFQ